MQKIINYMYEKELRPLELLKSFDKEGKFAVTVDDFFAKLAVIIALTRVVCCK